MDPFHVVRLGAEALDKCRQRVQHETLGHRGRKGDPLFTARRTLTTGADLLTDKQASRLEDLFADDAAVQVLATWGVYQRVVAAYRDKDRAAGAKKMKSLVEAIRTGVPTALVEITKLATTLTKRAADVLAYFDHPRTSNGPTEAINGRLEHLRGSALGFRSRTNCIAKSQLEQACPDPRTHTRSRLVSCTGNPCDKSHRPDARSRRCRRRP